LVEGPVVVSRKGEVRVLRGHPWVFRTDVVRAAVAAASGAMLACRPMSFGQAIALGVIQGLTEFLPVSSSGIWASRSTRPGRRSASA